jgi:outer membrane receptor protein involved in Fe transport
MAGIAASVGAFAQVPATAPEQTKIEIIGTAPAPGVDVPRDRIPANAQVIDARQLRGQQSISLPDFMANRLPSVSVNEVQGNPLQPSVNFRGFGATHLLGAPQGLSVYQDGVRLNEPFGDSVNWDLIPRNAISTVTLLPGSNPLFGLNTLGGAISIQTKSGDTHAGSNAQGIAGSFGRRVIEAEHGAAADGSAVFLALSRFREDGWRDHSPASADQLFGKLSHRDARLSLDLSLTHGNTNLTGNGLVPDSMLRQSRTRVFTTPDNTRNQMNMLAFNGALWLSEESRISGTVYQRRNQTRALNGDVNAAFESDAALDDAAGANGGLGFDNSTGANNRTGTAQRSSGVTLQWALASARHNFAVGLAHGRGDSSFEQSTGTGIFDASRSVIEANPGGAIVRNALRGGTRSSSLYTTETYALAPGLHVSASARYNRTRVATQDMRNFVPPNLDGDFTYSKLNPAIGITWRAADPVTAYAGYSQGNRAPSPVELGCADRANPCTLPNALASDPFLKQVVARTLEIGLRGNLSERSRWNAGVFRTDSYDDILFVGTTASAGYFSNFGKTRRQGAELGFGGHGGIFDWDVQYSHLRASFESAACLLSPNNSSRGQAAQCASPGDDLIRVTPGNRLPSLPRHNLKLSFQARADERSSIGADVVGFSSQLARGNENNQHQAGTVTLNGATREFLGSGSTPGYAILNLNGRHAMDGGWELFGRINNLFDRRYASAAALAESPFDPAGRIQTNSDNWRRETFVAPGAPRAAWIGLRYQIDAARNR